MKLSITTIIVLSTVLLVGIGTVQAETYTGCVTPGGTIIHLAVGESPLKPCKKNERRIHVDNRDARQNHDVDYNHAKVCEAFFQLGVDSAITDAMGCPTNPNAEPLGTVQRVYFGSFDENNSACGILKIEQRDEWGKFLNWVVDGRTGDPLPEKGGGFVAKHVQVPIIETDDDPCFDLCEDDPKCIAAYEHPGEGATVGTTSRQIVWCDIFHYSDTVTTGWNDVCTFILKEGTGPAGVFSPIDICKESTAELNTRWFVRCQDDLPGPPQ